MSECQASGRSQAFTQIGFDREIANLDPTQYRGSMPRLPANSLDCVFYLYPSREAAEAGRDFGGTGFLCSVPSEQFPKLVHHYYAITNWHVACRGHSVIRINTKSGGVDFIERDPSQWEFDPRYDVAVLPMPLKKDDYQFALVNADDGFLTKEGLKRERIGPGEDVFMVGRFIDHDGGALNLPAVRMGNISVMPSQIEQPNGRMTDAFCIDLHSRAGYSGSPVFVYRTPGYDLEDKFTKTNPLFLVTGANLLLLLGIHFSQFPEAWEIVSGSKPKSEGSEPLITDGKYIKGLSGMTCVLPAWTIREVLDMPKLKARRTAIDAAWAEKFKRDGFPPEAESAAPVASDENPKHREDFMRLQSVAAQKPKPDDQTS